MKQATLIDYNTMSDEELNTCLAIRLNNRWKERGYTKCNFQAVQEWQDYRTPKGQTRKMLVWSIVPKMINGFPPPEFK